MINRFLKAAMGAAAKGGNSDIGSAVNRLMGKGGLVKQAPNPANPAKTRNFATDAATGRHRSISKATGDRYASYGKARAVGNAKRSAVPVAALGAAAMMSGDENPDAMAAEKVERNPAEKKATPDRRGKRRGRGVAKPTGKGRGDGNKEAARRRGYADGKAEAAKKAPKNTSSDFDRAFAAARKSYKQGATNATTFTWSGKSYSIVTKADIAQAGSKDLKDFLNKGGKPKR